MSDPTLPPIADFNASTVTELQFRTALSALRGYLAGGIGTTGTAPAVRTALALGTAAQATLTTSTTDTTADRALRTGDWGLGGTAGVAPPGLDLNNAVRPGFYRADSDIANRPGGAGNWAVIVASRDLDNTAQFAMSRTATLDIHYRTQAGAGVWSPWRRVLIGTDAPPAPPGDDFNDATTFGPTQTFGAAANKPAGDGHAVLTLPRNATNRAQLTMRTDSAALRYATLLQGRQISSSGGVGEWVNFFHTRNILGTVSQTAGIPTGSVLQGNASAVSPSGGYNERTAAGFQIAHHSLTTSDSDDTTWTYSAAFLTGTTPVISIQPVGDSDLRVRLVSRTATACVFSVRDAAGDRVAVPVDLMARGRWSDLT
jgi:hypothetical protein